METLNPKPETADADKIAALEKKYPALYATWAARPEHFIECHPSDLRANAKENWKNYAQLLNKAILNNVTWYERREKTLNPSEVASGVMRNAAPGPDGQPIMGYDFLLASPPEVPCMTCTAAAFPVKYAHVLPALMIANFLKQNPNDNVDTTVICQGYGVEPADAWWSAAQTPDATKAVTCVVTSNEFQTFLRALKEERTKPILRICIWMLCVGHAFMIVWEQGARHDVIYFIDNAVTVEPIDDFRTAVLNAFNASICNERLKIGVIQERFKTSVFSTGDVEIQPDLVCVSFMARSTVFLNSMDVMVDKEKLKFIVDFAHPGFLAQCYLEFEKALVHLLTNCFLHCGTHQPDEQPGGTCVWLPAVMKNKFVNINDICLLVFDPLTQNIENATRFEFFFAAKSKFKAVLESHQSFNTSTFNGCTVCSEFTPNAAQPSIQLQAAARQCDQVLCRVLDRI